MAQISPYGVCYDVANSPYAYDFRGLRFRFSSMKHLERFRDQLPVKREWLADSLGRRFHVTIDADALAALQLYSQVEKRGYHVEVSLPGEVRICREPGSVRLGVSPVLGDA